MHARAVVLAAALALFMLPAATASGGHGAEEAEPLAAADMHEDVESGIRSIDLAPGQSWSHTFIEEGRFDYHCHPHPWMLAGITVVPSSGRAPRNYTVEIMEPTGQDFENWTFSPALTTIEVGDTVTWLNAGTVAHVVQETTAEHLEHVGTVGGAAADEHGVEAAAGDESHSASIGFPTQGWLWVSGALIGGVFVGRRLTGVKAPRSRTQAPAAVTATAASETKVQVSESSKGSNTEQANATVAAVVRTQRASARTRQKDRRRERRERRRNQT